MLDKIIDIIAKNSGTTIWINTEDEYNVVQEQSEIEEANNKINEGE